MFNQQQDLDDFAIASIRDLPAPKTDQPRP
jgi:hypothetical protein